MIRSAWPNFSRKAVPLLFIILLLLLSGCSSIKSSMTRPFTVAPQQQMVPIVPFTSTLVPAPLSEAVFNDYVDRLNDSAAKTGFDWFGIIKDDLNAVEQVLSPKHIFINGEIWSYIENSGCCSTELRIKSRLRIFRVLSRELLWETDIPLESFFEHDASTLPVERDKLGKRLAEAMTQATVKALHGAKRMAAE